MIHRKALFLPRWHSRGCGRAGRAAPGAVAAPGAAPAGPTVTLVTGDKVTLGGMNGAHVRAAKGREHVPFPVREDVDGDVHVIPEDAVVPLPGQARPAAVQRHRAGRGGYDDVRIGCR